MRKRERERERGREKVLNFKKEIVTQMHFDYMYINTEVDWTYTCVVTLACTS